MDAPSELIKANQRKSVQSGEVAWRAKDDDKRYTMRYNFMK